MTKIQKNNPRCSFYLMAGLSLGIVLVLGLLLLLNALSTRAQTQPTVADVSPNTVVNDSEHVLTIQGSGFEETPTVTVRAEPLLDVSYISTTMLTATLPLGFSVGIYTVTVTNPGGLSDSLPSGLTVQNPSPMLQGLSPDSGLYGQATVLTITGTHFVPTPTVALDGTPCSAVGYVSSTTLTATVPGGLLPGIYDLAVTNPGPGEPQDVLADAFMLYSPTPTVTGVDPGSAPNDLDSQVVIAGTNFAPTPTVTLDTVSLQGVTWVSSTRLSVLVPWGMDEGTYNLTVTNPSPGEASGTLSDAFTVTQGIGVWNAGELYGGSVEHVVINPLTPTTVYAASDLVGMFRSRDAAEKWALKYAGTHAGYVAIDPISPNRIYISAYGHAGGNYYRSDDEGDTWIPITTTFPTTPPPAHDCWGGDGIYPHPSNPGTVYVQGCDAGEDGTSGLIKSTNWGQDWVPAIDGLTDTQVTALAFHPDDPDIMFLGTAGGNVYRSFDGGGWWHHVSSPLGYVATLAVNPFGDHEVWVSSLGAFGAPCALLKSANADLTIWTAMEPLGQPVCAMSIDFAPTLSGTVFIAGFDDYKTTDGGDTWEPFGPSDASIQDIALHPTNPDIIYVGDADFGVHKTTDGGATWEIANQGLTAVVPRQIETVPGQPDIVYVSVGSGDIYKGIQGGGVWQRLPISGTGSFLVDPVTPAHVYAGLYGYIYASIDGGDTWPTHGKLVPPPQYAACVQLPLTLLTVPGQPGTVLAGMQHWCGSWPSPGSIYRSTDYGVHWDQVYPTGTQEISQVNDLAYDPVSPAVIYAATGEAGHGGGAFKSTDGGVNWEPVGVGVIDWALDVAVEPGTHRVFVSTGGLPLYVSDDGGETWARTGSGEGSNVYDILFAPGARPVLYDAAYQGLYRSTDGAQSWQRAGGALGQVTVYALGVVTTTDRVILYAGTTGGYLEGSAGQVSSQADTEGTLVNAGMYRYTTRRLTEHVFLPLVLRQYIP